MNRFLVAIGFATAFLIALELTYEYDPSSTNRTAFLWLGLILGALCLITFVSSGSRKIVFASVLSYGHLILIAAPAIHIGVGSGELRSYLRTSSALLFLSLIFIAQLGLLVFRPPLSDTTPRRYSLDGSYQILAVAVIALSLIANRIGGVAAHFDSLGLAAVVLSSFVTFTRPTISRAAMHGICLALIVAVYTFFIFSGFGRLELASYFFSIAIVFSWVFHSYWPKIATIIVSVPVYYLMTMKRVDTVEQRYGTRVSPDDTLVSVFGPFQSGSFIMQQSLDGDISPTHGESWLTSLLFWIPRSWWAEKPPGFGRAIVPVTQPEYVQVSEHSDAAPYLAEFIWDFGMIGLLLVPLLIWLIIRIDRWMTTVVLNDQRTPQRRNSAFMAAFLAANAGMLVNFAWGGSFAFTTRTAIPAIFLLALYLTSTKLKPASTSSIEPVEDRPFLPPVGHRHWEAGGLHRANTCRVRHP